MAKAKASEIPTAVALYIEIQNAFLVSKSAPGSWREIGYDAPNHGITENFNYGIGCIDSSTTMENLADITIGWVATSRVNLGDCPLGSVWAVTVSPSGSHISYSRVASSSECASLVDYWTVSEVNASGCNAAPEKAEESPKQPETDGSNGNDHKVKPDENLNCPAGYHLQNKIWCMKDKS